MSEPSDTKSRLLASAMALFSEKGFDGVAVDEIVDRARVNKRMVYHYFGSKEAIYREVLREVYSRLTKVEVAVVDPKAPIEKTLETLVRSYFAFLSKNPEFVQLILWENLGQGKHMAAVGEALSKAPILALLRQVLSRGIREGRIPKNFDSKHLLINLIGLCLIYFSNRHTLTRAVGMDLQSPRVLERGITQIVRLVQHGIVRPTR
jgi:AcrR family transcriptional regulator